MMNTTHINLYHKIFINVGSNSIIKCMTVYNDLVLTWLKKSCIRYKFDL